MQTLFTTAYLAPIAHFALWLEAKEPVLEAHCHFQKKTYRNRCTLLSANGSIDLSVPIQHCAQWPQLTREARISYDTAWQKLHWKTIESAYNRSPYFEFYRDELEPFYLRKEDFLWDWNLKWMNTMWMLLGIRQSIETSREYCGSGHAPFTDFRSLAVPKNNTCLRKMENYRQVFAEKIDFQANLSILDLLLNKGPESAAYLRRAITPGNRPG